MTNLIVLLLLISDLALGVLNEGKSSRSAWLRHQRNRNRNLNRVGKTSAAPTGIHAKGGKAGKLATRAFAGTDAAGKGPNPDQVCTIYKRFCKPK